MAARHISARRPASELSRLVAATIERVAPDGAQRSGEELLADALAAGDLDDIPNGPEELLFFASGPLYELVQQQWDDVRADALLLELAPVFDRAWARDRIELGADFVPQTASTVPGSSVRRRSGVRPSTREESAASEAVASEAVPSETVLPSETVPSEEPSDELVRADTIPAAPPATSISYIGSEDDALTDPVPPSSRRRPTIPYTPTPFLPRDHRARVLVVAHDAATRRKFVNVLTAVDCAVATAPDAACAAALYARLEPDLLLAEVETIAPDYEPLRAALEGVFGLAKSTSVVLLSEGRQRETTEDVVGVIATSTKPEQLRTLLDALLQER